MASNREVSLRGALRVQAEGDAGSGGVHRSTCATQPWSSVLEPATTTPSGSSTGFARMGPRMPGGSGRAGDHVRPSVRRRADETPPLARARARLVEEEQRAARGLEEHRVPAGQRRPVPVRAPGDLDGRRPAAAAPAREPDADVGVALVRAAEPRRDEPVRRLDERGSVRRGERRALEHGLRRDDRVPFGGTPPRRAEAEREASRPWLTADAREVPHHTLAVEVHEVQHVAGLVDPKLRLARSLLADLRRERAAAGRRDPLLLLRRRPRSRRAASLRPLPARA